MMPPRSHSNQSITSIGIPTSPSYSSATPSTTRAPLSSFRSTQEPKRPLRTTSSTHDEIDLSDVEDLKKASEKKEAMDGTGKKVVGGPRMAATSSKKQQQSLGATPGKASRGKVSVLQHGDTKGRGKERVTVCVRAKPSNAPADDKAIYDCDLTLNTISLGADHPTTTRRGGVTKGREEEGKFTVDHLHLPPQRTSDLFAKLVEPVVGGAMDGYNGTVFAYGMTGSGKTYTMGGTDEEPGVIPSAIDRVFDGIDEDKEREFLLRVSYVELYNEQLRDLLNPSSKLTPTIHEKEGRVVLSNVEEIVVKTPEEVQYHLKHGEANRRNGKTEWNEVSSRGHVIFSIIIESRLRSPTLSSPDGLPSSPIPALPSSNSMNSLPASTSTGSTTSSASTLVEGISASRSLSSLDAAAAGEYRLSRLNLIDLAGSERAVSDGERQKEGGYINKSLLVLGQVITALTTPYPPGSSHVHVPYRESKLTRLLQDSLSGHARIAVICTVSLEEQHAEQALATLKFARRVSCVVTKAERTTVSGADSSLLQAYQREIAELKEQLAAAARTEARQASELDKDSDDEIDGKEEEEGEKKRLQELRDERLKSEEAIHHLQLRRTKLQTQITQLSGLILTSNISPPPLTPTSSIPPARPTRRRISDGLPGLGLGLGLPGAGSGKRHVSAFGGPGAHLRQLTEEESLSEEGQQFPFRSDFKEEALLATLKTRLATLESTHSSCPSQADLDSLRSRIAALESDLTQSTHIASTSTSLIASLQSSLAESQASSRSLQEEIGQVKLERDAERLRAEEESKRAGGTIDLMEQGKKEMREMDREMDALREKLVAAEAGKEKEDVAEGEEKRELEREVGRMQVELEEEQTGRRIETDALKEQLQEVISSQTNSTKDLSAFQAELAALRTQLADQSAAHEAELARLASTSSSTASASQSTITTLETQVTSLTSALDQAKTDAATVSSASAQKLSSLQEELTAKGRTIAKLNKQLLVARAASGDEGAGGALKLSGLKAGAGARAGLAHSGSLRESAVRRPGLMGAGGKGGADSEEMKEIERLNKTITVQKELISQLQKSLARWAEQAKRNDEIIHQLLGTQPKVSASACVAPYSSPSLPTVTVAPDIRVERLESQPAVISSTTVSTSPFLTSTAPLRLSRHRSSASTSSLPSSPVSAHSPRTPSALTESNRSSTPISSQPPFRPTPLSRQSTPSSLTSPSSSTLTSTPIIPTTPSTSSSAATYFYTPTAANKPPPLPHASHQRSNSQARTARRITIEHDLQLAQEQSKVGRVRGLFDSPSSSNIGREGGTPTGGTPTGGTPVARAGKGVSDGTPSRLGGGSVRRI